LPSATSTLVPPSGFTFGTITSTTVTLNWDTTANLTYNIVYADTNGTATTNQPVGSDSSVVISDLLPGESYSFGLITSNAQGSVTTDAIYTTLLSEVSTLPQPTDVPDTPINLAYTMDVNSITLTWEPTDNTDNYGIYYQAPNSPWTLAGFVILPEITLTDLNAAPYNIMVMAVNIYGPSYPAIINQTSITSNFPSIFVTNVVNGVSTLVWNSGFTSSSSSVTLYPEPSSGT
jgi:hypothetical protein